MAKYKLTIRPNGDIALREIIKRKGGNLTSEVVIPNGQFTRDNVRKAVMAVAGQTNKKLERIDPRKGLRGTD